MRTAFIQALEHSASEDDRIVLVVGDVGFGVVNTFADRFPSQYINAGVAEQNMTGIAAGMAISGKIVFTYSIANFPTIRCLEQVRNDVCYHNADVKIVCVGGGFSYGSLGMSHHATEDIAIMRALPNMTVIAPGDPIEAAAATAAIVNRPGPCYLRLGRSDPIVHQTTIDFKVGEALTIYQGNDLTLISTGSMLNTTVTVAEKLMKRGIKPRVLSMHTIKPLDTNAVLAAAIETNAIVTIEEHSIIGGLGSAVAEVLAESPSPKIPFRRLGIDSTFVKTAGDQQYLRESFGLSVDSIIEQLLKILDGPGKTLRHTP